MPPRRYCRIFPGPRTGKGAAKKRIGQKPFEWDPLVKHSAKDREGQEFKDTFTDDMKIYFLYN
jgi:hypothetical protein